MVVVFCFVKCNNGNVFVFLKLIITQNKNNDEVNGKLFLIIKSGPGFMGSLIHSLIKRYSLHSGLKDLMIVSSCPRRTRIGGEKISTRDISSNQFRLITFPLY
jgi:hypothetical protein